MFMELIEVVSKFQIEFKGPPKADYMSILNRLMDASSVRPIRRRPPTGFGLWRDKSGKRSPPEADEHLPEACAAS
jgi:hypothetical protein